MYLNNQIAAHSTDKPSGYEYTTTSKLIDHGLITDVCEGGFPLFTPIGTTILESIENTFKKNALQKGFHPMMIPNAMRTDVLEKGQEIGEQFRSKIMHLTGKLEPYHVISSPEMLLVQWANQYQTSHKQLPIRYSYTDELHRQMPYTKGSLITRQIRIFGGFSVENKAELEENNAASHIRAFTEASLNELGLPFHVEDNYGDFEYEFFYICNTDNGTVEGDNTALPGIDPVERVKAFSLGMAYNYPLEGELRLRFRNDQNRNEAPHLITYGFCTQRVLYCLMSHSRDDKGFNLPEKVRPFDYYIIPRSDSCTPDSEELYRALSNSFNNSATGARPSRVALDNRMQRSVQQRCESGDYIGAPVKVVAREDDIIGISREGERLFTCKNAGEALQHMSLTI